MSGEGKKRPPPADCDDDGIVVEAASNPQKKTLCRKSKKTLAGSPGRYVLQARSPNSWSL